MYPILWRVGAYTLYSYTLLLTIGMLAGWGVSCLLARRHWSSPNSVLDGGFWALLGGVLGGRLGYVLHNGAYFVDHLGSAVAFWQGGLSWHGALIGGVVGGLGWWAVSRPHSLSRRDLLNVLAPGIALGNAFGWAGCLLTGSAYGAEAGGYRPPLAWLTANLPDIYGVWEVRFATQPLMMAWCGLVFFLLFIIGYRSLHSPTFALYLLLYASADFGVAFLRGDGTWRVGLWLGQWVALGEMVIAVGLLIFDRQCVGIGQPGRPGNGLTVAGQIDVPDSGVRGR